MRELFPRAKSVPTSEIVRVFLPALELKRDGSGREKALCPFHTEDTPSFTVYPDGWKCFGCGAHGSNVDLLLKGELASSPLEAARLIAEKFGIEVEKTGSARRKPLTLGDYAAYVNLPQDRLAKTFHIRETSKGLEMPYLNEAREEVATRIRTRLKAKEGSRWPRGTTPTLYGLWGLEKMKKAGNVFLVEGESDTQVCWFNQTPALGVPGASAFKPEWASLLLDFPEIAIIQEPGEAGEKFVKSIAGGLKQANYRGQVKAVTLPEKDPRDLWLKYGEKFKEELEAAITRAQIVDLYPTIPLTEDLIIKIADLLTNHVFFKDKTLPFLIAVWVLGTYVYDIFTFFGYLWINSPVKRCGKSLLEDILSQLCYQATPRLSNMTESTIFRLAEKGGTLIFDELENLRGQDREKYGMVMSVLNNGFQAGGKVPRTEKADGKWEVVYFNVFCPKVLAGISRLVDTIEDRSFRVSMVRKAPTEKVERFNLRRQADCLRQLREELSLWAEARKEAIAGLYDGLEEVGPLSGLDDRFKDISEPLVAIAIYTDAETVDGRKRIAPELISLLQDMAGKRGESERREAIGGFIEVAEEILGGEEMVFIDSAKLLERVKKIEELSWLESPKGLSSFLGKFDLHPKRKSGGEVRGYKITREWVEEAKGRYSVLIPDSEASQVSQTPAQSGPEALF